MLDALFSLMPFDCRHDAFSDADFRLSIFHIFTFADFRRFR